MQDYRNLAPRGAQFQTARPGDFGAAVVARLDTDDAQAEIVVAHRALNCIIDVRFLRNLLRCRFTPLSDSREPLRRDSGDITRNVPHRGRRIVSLRPEVNWREAMQKVYRTALRHSRISINHQVFPQSLRVGLVTEHGQRNSRIASDVLDLLMYRQVADHELFVLDSDPYYGDLRTAFRAERGQMSERSLFNQFADRLRNLHVPISLTFSG